MTVPAFRSFRRPSRRHFGGAWSRLFGDRQDGGFFFVRRVTSEPRDDGLRRYQIAGCIRLNFVLRAYLYTYTYIHTHARNTLSHTCTRTRGELKHCNDTQPEARSVADPSHPPTRPSLSCRFSFSPAASSHGPLGYSVQSGQSLDGTEILRRTSTTGGKARGVPLLPTRPRTLRHSRDPDCLLFSTVQVTPRRDRRAAACRLHALVFCVFCGCALQCAQL